VPDTIAGDARWVRPDGLLEVAKDGQLYLLPRGAEVPLVLDERGAATWRALESRGLEGAVAWVRETDGASGDEVAEGLRSFASMLTSMGALVRRA
jgi:hypothetical protein